jgi:hypothetical protein
MRDAKYAARQYFFKKKSKSKATVVHVSVLTPPPQTLYHFPIVAQHNESNGPF